MVNVFALNCTLKFGQTESSTEKQRLDTFLAEKADDGRPIAHDRVAVCAAVGNEDGAHHAGASIFQGLNDVGFTIPAFGMPYWVGRAMETVDFIDLETVPDVVESATNVMTSNAVHLCRLLRDSYPAQ